MTLSCLLGTTRCVPKNNFLENLVTNPLLTKLYPSRFLDAAQGFFFFKSGYMDLEIKTSIKKVANVQPSCLNAWSINTEFTIP